MPSWKMIVDFEKLREIGQELLQSAERVQMMADDCEGLVLRGVKLAWIGKNAETFVEKEVKHIRRLYDVGQSLDKSAKQLLEKAEQIYRLEQGNVLTAKTRTY